MSHCYQPVTFLLLLGAIYSPHSIAQQAESVGQEHAAGGENRSWIIRDPASGKLFRQEVVTVATPTTLWEARPVTTTVYEPKTVVKNLTSQQTVFVPTTQMTLQPRVRGWRNPFQRPVQTYAFLPVTSWQPQTQSVNNQVSAVEWIPKQQVVYVSQPVQRMQTQQQVVTTEIPQPSGSPLPIASTTLTAGAQPLVTFPLFANQRMLPWSAGTPINSLRSMATNGLRPISNVASRGNYYTAPLQTASASAGSIQRDSTQAGMTATVLR